MGAALRGNRFCHLEMVEALGEGGGGQVVRALDLRDGRPVALKWIGAESRQSWQLESLTVEFELLSSLEHPGFPRAFDLLNAPDGRCGFSMELLHGGVLSAARLSPTEDHLLLLMTQALDALSVLHGRGLSHGDISPRNMYITEEGSSWRLKMLDLGLAIPRGGSGSVQGSPIYLAPELLGKSDLTPASDLYSLGVVLYEWLAGVPPIVAKTAPVLFQAKVEGNFQPLHERVPHIYRPLLELVDRMLAADPERRPPNAWAAWGELEELTTGHPLGPACVRVSRLPAVLPEAQQAAWTRLVGREGVLGEIGALLYDVEQQDVGRIAWIDGGAGMGKTALAREIAITLQRRGQNPVYVRCRSERPYGLIRNLILPAIFRDETAADQILQRYPGAAAMLFPERFPTAEAVADLEEVWADFAEEVSTLWAELLGRDRFVYLIDDLHRADGGSLRVLRQFALRLERSSVLIVCLVGHLPPSDRANIIALRDIFTDEGIIGQSSHLEPLTLEQVRTRLVQLFGECEIVTRLCEPIRRTSAGVPWNLMSLLRALVENGALYRVGRGWDLEDVRARHLLAKGAGGALAFVGQQLEGLHGEQVVLLELLAVFGGSAPYRVVASLSDLPAVQLETRLGELGRLQLIHTSTSQVELESSHLVDVILGRMGVARRKRLHARAGQWLLTHPEQVESGTPVEVMVTHHLLQAGKRDLSEIGFKAVLVLRSRLAYEEARRLCMRLIEAERAAGLEVDAGLLEQQAECSFYLGDTSDAVDVLTLLVERLRKIPHLSQGDRRRQIRYLHRLGSILSLGGRRAEAATYLEQAREKLGADGDLRERASLLWDLAMVRQHHGDLQGGIQLARLALDQLGVYPLAVTALPGPGHPLLAPDTDILTRLALRLLQAVGSMFWLLRSPDAEVWIRTAGEMVGLDMDGPVVEIPHNSPYGEELANLLVALGSRRWTVGRLGDSERFYLAARHYYERAGRYHAAARIYNNLAILQWQKGEWQDAQDLWERFRRVCHDTRMDGDLAIALNNLGMVYTELGQLPQGRRRYEQALERSRRSGEKRLLPMLNGNLGEVHFREGSLAVASRLYRRALILARRQENRADELETLRRQVELELELGSLRTVKSAEHALSLARQLQAREEEGILQGLLGLALVRHGSGTGGLDHILEGERILSELGSRLHLARLKVRAAEAWKLLSRIPEAEQRLSQAEETFVGYGAQWDILRVRRLRERLDLWGGGSDGGTQQSLQILLDVTRSVGSELDLERLLGVVVAKALEVTRTERGFVVLFDDYGRPTVKAGRRMGRDEVEGQNALLSSTVLQRVLKERKLEAITDVSQFLDLKDQRSIVALGVRSILAAPMLRKDRLLGVIYVDSSRVTQGFFNRDKRLLEALAEAAAMAVENAQLYEALKRKNDHLYIMAHEFRNTLTGIIGFGDLLSGDADTLRPEHRNWVRIMTSEGRRASRMASDMLDLGKMEVNQVEWSIDLVNLEEVVHASVETAQPAAHDRQVRVVAGEPSGHRLPSIFGNADRLSQVLTNLIANAMKFAPHGGEVRVSVTVGEIPLDHRRRLRESRENWIQRTLLGGRSVSRTRCLWCRVEDNGTGLPAAAAERLFEKFSQFGDRNRRAKGTGLGLAICREIIEHHGGRISGENRPEGGAVFTFWLPLAEGN